MPKCFTDMNSITKDFFTLMNTVEALNPQASIVICGFIPRLGDWVWDTEFSLELNDFLQKWCCAQVKEGNRAIFGPVIRLVLFSKEWHAVAWSLQVGGSALIQCWPAADQNSACSRRSQIPTLKEDEPGSVGLQDVLVPAFAPARSEGTS